MNLAILQIIGYSILSVWIGVAFSCVMNFPLEYLIPIGLTGLLLSYFYTLGFSMIIIFFILGFWAYIGNKIFWATDASRVPVEYKRHLLKFLGGPIIWFFVAKDYWMKFFRS